MTKSASITLLLFAFLFSCCKSSTEPKASVDLIPLTTGNTWIYDAMEIDGNGRAEGSMVDSSVAGLSIDDGGKLLTFYSIPASNSMDNPLSSLILFRSENGVWAQNPGTGMLELLMPYPGVVGSEYMVFSDSTQTPVDGPITQLLGNIISANDTVTTPAGFFHCTHYVLRIGLINASSQKRSLQEPLDIYLAPGVGIVKTVEQVGSTTDSTGNAAPTWYHWTRLLRKYTLK